MLSKVFGIQILTTEGVGFIVRVKLAASFERTSARRSVSWRGC